MAWYSTGTVTATNGSATVTGSGTSFLGNVRVGDGIAIAGSTSLHEVTGVSSDTQLTIAPVYPGTTGGSKTYRVAPVLGYDKDLSDAFNDIRLTWGTQLSALKPWATAATAAQARTDLGLGSAATRTALGTTGSLYSRDSILGTVSQSAGVPTGAVIESGSNANGTYVRFADGTQICTGRINVSGGATATISSTWTYPAVFSASPEVSARTIGSPLISTRERSEWASTPGNSSVTFGVSMNVLFPDPTTFNMSCLAIGRWF